MNYKNTFKSSLKSAWIVLKLIIPIYILAEILFYYNTLSYIAFLVEPFTSILGLPKETALSIISGLFLIWEEPFRVGDVIEIIDKKGTIVSIDLLSLQLVPIKKVS